MQSPWQAWAEMHREGLEANAAAWTAVFVFSVLQRDLAFRAPI